MIAIFIGATGLVGKNITKTEVEKVVVFSIRSTGMTHSKLQ